jgi:hypothetical protein
LEHVKGLDNLYEINLNNTRVTDERLVHLKGLSRLRSLSLDKTQVTGHGVAELQRAMPRVMIWWFGKNL